MGIIFLFICTGIIPSVAVDTIKKPSTPISDSKTLYVGGTGEGNYTKIQDAINDLSNGDTVFVFDDSSPYYENIVVNKSINLHGEDRNTTIIDGNYSGNVVNISTDWVNISGFTIKYGYSYGIDINSSYNTITGNIISNNKVGIILHSARHDTIMGNTISKNIKGIAMVQYNSDHTILKNNFFLNIKNVFFRCTAGTSDLPLLLLNKWSQNYWGRPQILPKLLFGTMLIIIPAGGDFPPVYILPLPLFNIDWYPAKEPYNIGV